MKAFLIDRYAGKDGLRMGEAPEPELGKDDVLVDVHAAGVNPLDLKIASGELKPILRYRLPFIMGNDVAGVVVQVGSAVRRFQPGDEVYARPPADRIGAFAERIAIDAGAVAQKPKSLTMVEAASLPLVGLTAWQALVQRAQVRRGQRVLVHAGSGGVGTIAIQLARHLGAFVATTTSTANVDFVKQLGADVAIDYRKEDFAAKLRDFDVVLDTLGGDTLEKSVQVLKPGGLLVSVSGPPDPDFARELGSPLLLRLATPLLSHRIRKLARRHGLRYSFLFMKADGEQLGKISELVDAGVIRPVVDRVFRFESTNDALAYVGTGRARGKVVIERR
jgi:NADPH:quinone reductase-like Zn-dependent oxidoreductase